MINSVNSNMDLSYTGISSQRQTMTENQKSGITDILSNYNANSLSKEDATAINNSFKELNIRPSRALRETIEASGVDANSIRTLGSENQVQEKQPPPPPPPPQKSDDESANLIDELLAEILQGDDEETTSLTTTEQIMDYTNRIMHLNDDAKSEVKDLFETFKLGNTDYTKEEVGKIITRSLGEILGNTDNYNHVEFYG